MYRHFDIAIDIEEEAVVLTVQCLRIDFASSMIIILIKAI